MQLYCLMKEKMLIDANLRYQNFSQSQQASIDRCYNQLQVPQDLSSGMKDCEPYNHKGNYENKQRDSNNTFAESSEQSDDQDFKKRMKASLDQVRMS